MKRLAAIIAILVLALTTIPASASPSIMGTPAQLVEDLMAGGIDLSHSRFTKPELLSKATRNMYASGLWDYHFTNIKLTFAESNGAFDGFEIELPSEKVWRAERVTPPTSSLPLGQFQSVVGGKFEDLATRYGTEYALPDETVSWNEVTYWIWSSESKTLWAVNFSGLEGKGVDQVWCYSNDGVQTISYLHDGTVLSSHSGTKKLFSDLAECGLAIGAADNDVSALGKGRILSDPPDLFWFTSKKTTTIGFKNGAVRLEERMDKVDAFYIHNMREPWTDSIDVHFRRFFSKDAVLDLGGFGKALNSGIRGIERRYGPSYFPLIFDDGGSTEFYTLVRTDSGLKYVTIYFRSEGDYSCVSGHIEASNVYPI